MTKKKLYLDGFVGQVWDFWADEMPSTSYKGMKANLEKAEGEGIELHINSKGGDAFEGMAMLNLLKDQKGEKVAVVDGICASAATLPLFAMDKVQAHETSMFLFHKSATMAFGHSSDLRKSADELDTIDSTIVDLYMKKFKGSEDELHALLDDDKLVTAKYALEIGLIDEIIADLPAKEDDKEEPENTTGDSPQAKAFNDVVAEVKETADENNERFAKLAKVFENITI